VVSQDDKVKKLSLLSADGTTVQSHKKTGDSLQLTYLQVLFEVMWWRVWPWASCWVGSLRWHIGLRAWPLTRTTHHIGRGSLVHCGTSPPLGTQPNCHGLHRVVPENLISNQNQWEFLFLTPSAPNESKCCICYMKQVSKY